MKIARNLFGTDIAFELNDEELRQAFSERLDAQLTDNILEKYSAIHGEAPSDKVFDRIFADYKKWWSNLYIDENGVIGAAQNEVSTLCYNNPPEKKMYPVTLYIHAANETEAKKIAFERLGDLGFDFLWKMTEDDYYRLLSVWESPVDYIVNNFFGAVKVGKASFEFVHNGMLGCDLYVYGMDTNYATAKDGTPYSFIDDVAVEIPDFESFEDFKQKMERSIIQTIKEQKPDLMPYLTCETIDW